MTRVPLLRITVVCSDPCEGWPCFECELMTETLEVAIKRLAFGEEVDLKHRSVEEACEHWKSMNFNDLDAPYFMVGDEVKLSGPQWRSASMESVVSILAGSAPHR